MSHLAPQAAIFSPSIARAAASTAKDWAYVDAWLKRQWTHLDNTSTTAKQKQHQQRSSPPSFERNPETLEVLLTLIAANEEADEERHRLASLEAAALEEVRAAERDKELRRNQIPSNSSNGMEATTEAIHADILAEDLLQALDAGLSKEGQTALDALADVSLSLNTPTDPTPSNLSRVYLDLQGAAHEISHLLHRVELLQTYLDDESARLQAFLEDLRGGLQYQIPPEDNVDGEDAVVSSRIPEMRRCVESLEKKVGIPALTVEDLRIDEEAYLDRLARKKDLDAQVKAFAGLPPDVEAARAELENLRAQLREATERRDANFEMLVERESPVKVRTSRRF